MEPGWYWLMSKDKRYKLKWVNRIISDEDYEKADAFEQFDAHKMSVAKERLLIGPKIDEPIESLFREVD